MRVWIWAVVCLYGVALGASAHPAGQQAFQVDALDETGGPSLPLLRSWSMRTLERTLRH